MAASPHGHSGSLRLEGFRSQSQKALPSCSPPAGEEVKVPYFESSHVIDDSFKSAPCHS
jgi:hypothetical protein